MTSSPKSTDPISFLATGTISVPTTRLPEDQSPFHLSLQFPIKSVSDQHPNLPSIVFPSMRGFHSGHPLRAEFTAAHLSDSGEKRSSVGAALQLIRGLRYPSSILSSFNFLQSISIRSTMGVTSADFNGPHAMGTTIIDVTYNDGVILGADSRTSTGVYVANRASD